MLFAIRTYVHYTNLAMPEVLFIEPDGSRRLVMVAVGESLMAAAIRSNVKGIDADCGGCCSCATCHVHIDPASLAMIPPAGSIELDMLEGVAAQRSTFSRLSCQIVMTDDIASLKVTVPDKQSL